VTRRGYHCRGRPGSSQGKPAVGGRQKSELWLRGPGLLRPPATNQRNKNMVPLCRRQKLRQARSASGPQGQRVIGLASGGAETVVLGTARLTRMGRSFIAATPSSKLRLRTLRPSTMS